MQPTINFDFARPMEYLQKLEARAKEVSRFIGNKTTNLLNRKVQIEDFLRAANCSDLKIGNMYSTGGAIEPDYTENNKMICICTMKQSQEYKNPKLRAEKLDAIFSNNVFGISANFHSYKIKGLDVEFNIYV